MYKKSISFKKAAVPVVVMIGGAQVLQYVSTKIGMPLSDDLSTWIIVSIWGIKEGITNWLKNRFK